MLKIITYMIYSVEKVSERVEFVPEKKQSP